MAAFAKNIKVNTKVVGTQPGITFAKKVAYAQARLGKERGYIQGGMVAFAADSVMGSVVTGDTSDRVCVDLGNPDAGECFRVMGVVFQDGGGEGSRASTDKIAIQIGGIAVMCNTSNKDIAQGEMIYVLPGERFNAKNMGRTKASADFQLPVLAGESNLNAATYVRAKKMRIGRAQSTIPAGKYGRVQLAM